MSRTLYVAGPMTGHQFFNFPAFHEAERTLAEAGFDVVSPAAADEAVGFDPIDLGLTGFEDVSEHFPDGSTLADVLQKDLGIIAQNVDGIAVLDGWEESKGAQAEVALARALGKPVRTVGEWATGTAPATTSRP